MLLFRPRTNRRCEARSKRGSLASFFESGLHLNPDESLPPDKKLDTAHWELASQLALQLALWIAQRGVIKMDFEAFLLSFLWLALLIVKGREKEKE